MREAGSLYSGYLNAVTAEPTRRADHVAEQVAAIKDSWGGILRQPDWYTNPTLTPFLETWIWADIHGDPRAKAVREPFYVAVAQMLEEDHIPLGKTGPDFDAKRRQRVERGLPPIDTLVIHHSEGDGGRTTEDQASMLNAIGFLRLYTQDFAHDPSLRGKPVWSGHFTPEGQQVFFTYNALVNPNGDTKWLLKDPERKYRLWHAGAINDKSAALVAVGNYENSTPPTTQLVGLAGAIRSNYGDVLWDQDHILGHNEVNDKKTCPGRQFLGENGWKNRLIGMLR